ncbi:MAG: DNA repair protein RadA [Candidatus Hydrogenedentota bacterium]
MPKAKVVYVCQECGITVPRWMGKCPECEAWNTLVEEQAPEAGAHVRGSFATNEAPIPITQGPEEAAPRMTTGIAEFDRVMGGGVVDGSITLIGGDPGIGKSTLMLQVAHRIAAQGMRVLYVSAEESFEQTRLRARRLHTLHDNLLLYTENNVGALVKRLYKEDFALVVVDSIQSVYSTQLPGVPGSVSQVRESAAEFLRLAKGKPVPICLVGHVTKDGQIAGPRLLEHLVDGTLYFEGEGKQALRILRAVKNRFGSTNEIGVFEMRESGLHEVANPSAWFLNERPDGVSGSVVLPSIEGSRPLLVEVQALVGDSHTGSPRRTVTGVNPNRVSLLLAVLEKRAGLHFADRDVFVNVAGGARLEEPAADMAVALALVSSFRDMPVPPDVAAFGEVGLAGEIRAVDRARQRVAEAAKFGFAQCVLPKGATADVAPGPTQPVPVATLVEAIDLVLES